MGEIYTQKSSVFNSMIRVNKGSYIFKAILLGSAYLLGCANGADSEQMFQDDSCAQGKCDRVSDEVQELYSDMKRVNLDDLISLGYSMY